VVVIASEARLGRESVAISSLVSGIRLRLPRRPYGLLAMTYYGFFDIPRIPGQSNRRQRLKSSPHSGLPSKPTDIRVQP
jgi:hypothetical protein